MIKEYYADGYDKQSYFTQLSPHTPPNNTSHYSGCGATAWMNLFGWHNLNFTPNLLEGEPRENNEYSNKLTMQLHDYLHTIRAGFSDSGLTWPWLMKYGNNFSKDILSHSANGYKYRVRSFTGAVIGYRNGDWVFEIIKEYIIEKKKPVIVGYIDDWHYAIGYGILQVPMEAGGDSTYFIKINRGWGPEWAVENEALISPNDLISCYGVEQFIPIAQ